MRSLQGGACPDRAVFLSRRPPDLLFGRAHHSGYYTRLIKMYRKLGIKLQPTYYTYSFSHLLTKGERPKTHFLHQGRSGLASLALPAGDLRTKLSGVLRLVQYALCYLYLLILAYAYQATGSPGGSVATWAADTGRGRWFDWVANRWEQFVREILYTLFGAISSASDQQLANVDIGLFLGAPGADNTFKLRLPNAIRPPSQQITSGSPS